MNLSAYSSGRSRSQSVVRELGGFRIVAESRAAGARKGGDFWIATASEQGRLAVVIGDACGHGSESAELVEHLLPAVRELSRFGAGPGWLLWELNRRMQGWIADDRFVTAAAFEIDLAAGTFCMANAGHIPALLRRASGGVAVIGRPSGPPLGMAKRSDYGEERCSFRVGDVLVSMTDGVFEEIETDLLRMDTLRSLIAGAGRGSRAVQRAVLGLVERSRSARAPDDMTLLSLEARSDGALVPLAEPSWALLGNPSLGLIPRGVQGTA